MAQQAKILDITKSYVPVNPITFPATLHATTKEDHPVDAASVVPYRGYNFLPTEYGYKSYFGTNADVATLPLNVRVDEIFPVQTDTLRTMLVALCEDGLRLLDDGVWTHPIVLPVPAEGVHYDWSYCYVDQRLFCYRAQEASVYEVRLAAEAVTLPSPDTAAAGFVPASFTISGYGTPIAAASYSYYMSALSDNGIPILTAVSTLVANTFPKLLFEVAAVNFPGDTLTLFYTTDLVVTAASVFKKLVLTATGAPTSPTRRFEVDLTLGVVSDELLLIRAGTVATRTPTFLNMAGQQGIFSAGMRLGFWDSSNSIAWSSIDDPMEFTPSIQTLAGSALFSLVKGKILRCLAHAEGFVIYSTGSVVLVSAKPEATFQWESTSLLNTGGINYPKQCVASYPDNVHFAFTKLGIIKIEDQNLEFIVPQFYDELKALDTIVFLNILDGRYLCFEVLDEEFLLGRVAYENKIAARSTLSFMTEQQILAHYAGVTLTGNAACYTAGPLIEGGGSQGAAGASNSGVPIKPGTFYKALWEVTYPSLPVRNVLFVANACSTPLELIPNSLVTSDYVNGAPPYFVTQSSTIGQVDPSHLLAAFGMILKNMTDTYDAYVQEILSQSDTVETGTTTSGLISMSPTPSIPAGYETLGTTTSSTTLCGIGNFLSDWSDPVIAMGNCDTEISVYALGRKEIKALKEVKKDVTISLNLGRGWANPLLPEGTEYATAYDCCRSQNGYSRTGNTFPLFPDGTSTVTQCYIGDWSSDNFGTGSAGEAVCYAWPRQKRQVRNYVTGYNKVTAYETGIFAKLTVKIALVGWRYTGTDGAQHTVALPADTSWCMTPAEKREQPLPPNLVAATNPEGSVCGIPFAPINWPDGNFPLIQWPTQTVTLPATSYLLQDGSLGPIYPTYAGAFVYDLHMKKWGKFKQEYKQLVNYTVGVNGQGAILDTNISDLSSGMLHADGRLSKFDSYPTASELVYGKIGYYRLGFTSLEEVLAQFARPCTGSLIVEGSLDGHHIEHGLTEIVSYDNIKVAQLQASTAAKWYNIVFSGHYDITHLEFRGNTTSRR